MPSGGTGRNAISIFFYTVVFFHLKNTEFDWDGYEDLKSLRVGGSIGYDYGKEFKEAENKREPELTKRRKN